LFSLRNWCIKEQALWEICRDWVGGACAHSVAEMTGNTQFMQAAAVSVGNKASWAAGSLMLDVRRKSLGLEEVPEVQLTMNSSMPEVSTNGCDISKPR
jgi:hypothetical protein